MMEELSDNVIYLTRQDITQEDKKTIFKYRVRMERFGENYRGGAESISCPLCHTHLDNQEMSYQCPEIKKEIDIKGNFSDIYNENIQNETIETIVRISRYRTKVLVTKSPTEVGPCVPPCDVLLETTQCPT